MAATAVMLIITSANSETGIPATRFVRHFCRSNTLVVVFMGFTIH
jgi:hypothetical protein